MSIFDDSKPEGFQYPDLSKSPGGPDLPDPDVSELYPGHAEQMEREVLAIGHAPIVDLMLKADTALAVLAGLQLALRHPHVGDQPVVVGKIRMVAMAIESSFAPFPALAACAADGWGQERNSAETEGDASPDDPDLASVAVPPEQEQRESAFLMALPIGECRALESEAVSLLPPDLREKLEAHYAAGRTPGPILAAALTKARWEAVRRRMRHVPND